MVAYWVVLGQEDFFKLVPSSYGIGRQGIQPLFGFVFQGEREESQFETYIREVLDVYGGA